MIDVTRAEVGYQESRKVMCFAFYLFSNDVILAIEWDRNVPAVFVSKLARPLGWLNHYDSG